MVEYQFSKLGVASSSLVSCSKLSRHRLSVRTRDFHSLKRGSIPRGDTFETNNNRVGSSMVEHRSEEPGVGGSSPSQPTYKNHWCGSSVG